MKTLFALLLISSAGFCTAQQTSEAAKQATAKAEARAVELYPEINVAGSALRTEMLQISAWLEKTGDPLLLKPDCGLRVAHMAAAKLGIKMRTKTQAEVSESERAIQKAEMKRAEWEAYAMAQKAEVEKLRAQLAQQPEATRDPYTDDVNRRLRVTSSPDDNEATRTKLAEQKREADESRRQAELVREIRKAKGQ